MEKLKTRDQIAAADKWQLEDMFATDEAWEQSLAEFKTELLRLGAYKGILKNAKAVKGCLSLTTQLESKIELLYVYAHARFDENNLSDKYMKMHNVVRALFADFAEAVSFVEPELSALSKEKLEAIAANKMLKDYDYYLKRLIDGKPHILSAAEEKLLAQSGNFASMFQQIFFIINDAELALPEIEINGEKTQLTHGAYQILLTNTDQAVREKTFKEYYSAFIKKNNTFATIYSAEVLKNIFYSRARKYASYLDSTLWGEDVPAAVYKTLISSVDAALPAMHEYVHLRKKLLGLEKLNMYDMYVSVIEGAELKLSYKDAYKLVVEGLVPLGEEYSRMLKKAYKTGWIDVYETPAKRSGAYCTHAKTAQHPYVLLNYKKTTHDVFTIAHEMGHAMHSYYSSKTQPESKADYKIFVAEVASTVNEMLLLSHILKTTADTDLKKSLLAYKLDMIRTTIFRQTMFSEFELMMHEAAERGEPLTAQVFNDAYYGLNKKYYGSGVEHNDEIKYEWSRIPHFYMSFYVYKYATGLTAAIKLSEDILSGDEAALKRYFNFLKAGGSKSPYEILKDAGADLATAAPYQKLAEVFNNTLNELKKLA